MEHVDECGYLGRVEQACLLHSYVMHMHVMRAPVSV